MSERNTLNYQNSNDKEDETVKSYVYAESANGLMVRIPKDRYPQWKATQDRIKAGENVEPDPEIVRQLCSLMENRQDSPQKAEEAFPLFDSIKQIHIKYQDDSSEILKRKRYSQYRIRILTLSCSLIELILCFVLKLFGVSYLVSISIATALFIGVYMFLNHRHDNKYGLLIRQTKQKTINELKKVVPNYSLIKIVGAPIDTVLADHLPINGEWCQKKWASESGSVYHDDFYCAKKRAYLVREYHQLVMAQTNRPPCYFCGTPITVPDWYKRYTELRKILEQYGFKVEGNGKCNHG